MNIFNSLIINNSVLSNNKIIPQNHKYSNLSFKSNALQCDVFERDIDFQKDIRNLCENYNNRIELVASDIDGTLLAHGQKTCSKNIRDAFKALKNAELPLVLATGKSKETLSVVLRDFDITCDYYIINQGAAILDKNKNVVCEKCLPLDDVEKVLDVTEELIARQDITKVYLICEHKRYGIDCKLDKDNIKEVVSEIIKDMKKCNKKPYMIIFVKKDNKDIKNMDDIKNTLASNLLDRNVDIVIGAPHSCEVVCKGMSKAAALNKVAKLKGIQPKNIAAIGDGDNDRPMMQFVNEAGGLSIAIKGGYPKLEEESSFITDSVQDDGFALAVENIIKNNNRLKKLNFKD